MLLDLSVWLKMILIVDGALRNDADSENTTQWGWAAYSLLSSCVELPSFPSTSGHHSVFQKLVSVTAKKNWHCCYFPPRCPATLTHSFLFMKYCFCTAGFEAWKYSHMHCWLYLLHPHFYQQNLVPYYCASSFIHSMNRLWNHEQQHFIKTMYIQYICTSPHYHKQMTLFSCTEWNGVYTPICFMCFIYKSSHQAIIMLHLKWNMMHVSNCHN